MSDGTRGRTGRAGRPAVPVPATPAERATTVPATGRPPAELPAAPDGTGSSRQVTGASQRAPRQERGRRRVDEILDAAEVLIVEVGPAATAIQEIARRAGASVGSIYHFFPTKDAIFDALRARYDAEAGQMLVAMRASVEEAAGLPLRALVERLVAPVAELLERRPAMFALGPAEPAAGSDRSAPRDVEVGLREALIVALRARSRASTPVEVARRADVLGAIMRGIATLMASAAPASRRELVGEMSRAIYGYLLAFEEDGAPTIRPPGDEGRT